MINSQVGANFKEKKIFNAWGVNVKLTWEVPRYTRTYLLQRVLAPGFTSSRTEVLARFVTFFRSLRSAPSHEVRTAALLSARDLRTVTSRNVALVREESGEDPWTASTTAMREALRERELVQPEDRDLTSLLEQRQYYHYGGRTEEENQTSDLIIALCKN